MSLSSSEEAAEVHSKAWAVTGYQLSSESINSLHPERISAHRFYRFYANSRKREANSAGRSHGLIFARTLLESPLKLRDGTFRFSSQISQCTGNPTVVVK